MKRSRTEQTIRPHPRKSSRSSTAVLVAVLSLLLLGLTPLVASPTTSTERIKLKILPEVETIAAGEPFTIAFKFDIIDEWHLYWTNPGDAGLAPTVRWKLPEGFSAGELKFPPPEKIPAGPLVSFGYAHQLVLLTEITPPRSLDTGKEATIEADFDWLVCREECIPERGAVSITIPTANKSEPHQANQALIDSSRVALPQIREDWSFIAEERDDSLIVIAGTEAGNHIPEAIFLFPDQKGVIENAAAQSLTTTDDGFRLAVPRNSMFTGTLDSLSGILVSDDGWGDDGGRSGIWFTASLADEAEDRTASSASITAGIGIWEALLFAFIGGLILNLMPCVLPVLSIKIL